VPDEPVEKLLETNLSAVENPMKTVKLSELINALEFDSEEYVNRVADEALHDLPDWQNEEIEIARRMVDDEGERFRALTRQV
jgi:hypothetical protein